MTSLAGLGLVSTLSLVGPLSVQGDRFVDPHGRPVTLLGAIVCCDAPDTPVDDGHAGGWPLVGSAFLDQLKAHGLNWTHVRPGPHLPRHEGAEHSAYHPTPDGRVDLDRWNAAFWDRARRAVASARERAIYVEVALFDHWTFDHRLSAWNAENNVSGVDAGDRSVGGRAPEAVHLRWIEKVVLELGEYENVLLVDGNESWKGARPEWSLAVRDFTLQALQRAGHGRRPFGTNSHDPVIENAVDYVARHGLDPYQATGRPVMVTEYDTPPVDRLVAELEAARSRGILFHYWMGSHTAEERQRVLGLLAESVSARASPTAR